MKIPEGKTEAEVLEAIEKVVAVLASGFTFGPFQTEDIAQEIRLGAIRLLERGVYDPSRPLENFLYTSLKRLLINLVRDNSHRSDAPCRACHSGFPCRPEGPCDAYAAWYDRNRRKANLLSPLDLDNVADEKEKRTRAESTVEEDVAVAELLERIDRELPAALRSDYLKMRDGVTLPRCRRAAVEEAVTKIIGDVS